MRFTYKIRELSLAFTKTCTLHGPCVLNIINGLISLHYHMTFDNFLKTTHQNHAETLSPAWQQLVWVLHEQKYLENRKYARKWTMIYFKRKKKKKTDFLSRNIKSGRAGYDQLCTNLCRLLLITHIICIIILQKICNLINCILILLQTSKCSRGRLGIIFKTNDREHAPGSYISDFTLLSSI